jgi:hypothetical protein
MPALYCPMDGSTYMISTTILTADFFPIHLTQLSDLGCRLFGAQNPDSLILTNVFLHLRSAGATVHYGMFTPSRLQIPPLACQGVRVSPFIYFYLSDL